MKNNQIAALLQELRILKGKVEVRDHELANLRERTSAEIRAKGEVIVRLNGMLHTARDELEVANAWVDRERAAREVAEASLEAAEASLGREKSLREASQKRVEGKLECPCLALIFCFDFSLISSSMQSWSKHSRRRRKRRRLSRLLTLRLSANSATWSRLPWLPVTRSPRLTHSPGVRSSAGFERSGGTPPCA